MANSPTSVTRLLVLSFIVTILIGAFLLYIVPTVGEEGAPLSGVDALFTSTSAVCVTGLVVRDTGGEFSLPGQIIILALIQIGGLGFLTLSNFIFLLQGGRVNLKRRLVLEETYGILPKITAADFLYRIVSYTFAFEFVGAVILSWRFSATHPVGEAVWLGTFHAISAFCNAGFSLFSDSLVSYRSDMVVNFTVMSLIIAGGLGFVVFVDLNRWARSLFRVQAKRLSLHSRVVLRTSLLLVVAGAIAFWVMEIHGQSMEGSVWNHMLESLFMSVTTRTAGFNSLDVSHLTNGSLLVVIILMCIGGSPGSTAGGVKTTTAASLFALISSRTRNRPRIELMDNSLPAEIIAKALITSAGFLIAAMVAVLLLQVTELHGEPHYLHRGVFLEYLFEVVSALGTVGLSTGITAGLTVSGKTVIIICMFLGRLGPTVVAGSLIGMRKRVEYSYPEGRIIVG